MKNIIQVQTCEYCGNYMSRTAKSFGKHGAFDRIECWFQASAEEYATALNAITALERPVEAPALATIATELSDLAELFEPEYCGCDEQHAPSCVHYRGN
jgi:hypothetical protein